ncbi:MAG: hypothetical protein GY774_28870 [Planctomycetes bacterium]|nr:hypothetical protein [Planctomycetota bacterium]
MQIPMNKCKNIMAVTWFTYSCFLFFVFLLQTILGKYGDYVTDAWGWFFPTLMPTLSLMLGVFVADALGKKVQIQTVDRFFFRLAFCLSITYLLVVTITFFSLPFVSAKPQEMMNFLKQSNLWLGPLQGLVSASIGVFFVKRQEA